MSDTGIPLHFVLLDQSVAEEALRGHEDILAGESKKAEALYRQHLDCRNGCGRTMEKSYGGGKFAFNDPGWLIPRCLLKCYACDFTINPFNGMTVAVGDTDKAKYGNIPLINTDG